MEFYLGIDFGTTNSAIARGGIDAFTSKILPEILPVEMQGLLTAQQIVPSVALYEYGKRQCRGVGYAAKKSLMDVTPLSKDLVAIKSVKLQLGRETVENAEWLKPEEVVSDILLFLKSSFERKFNNLPNVTRAVIGIPASFPSDMCEKTVVAGRLAGFDDVSLIPEPQAALLDFMLHQSRYAPSSQITDFSSPKNVMVFDLCGGTLDVTIVKVSLTEELSKGRYKPEISYEALGLSRFTDLGGDLFDKLLTDYLVDTLSDQTGLNLYDIPNELDRKRSINMLNEYSEATKQLLTNEVNSKITFEKLEIFEAMDKSYYDIAIPNIPLNSGSLSFSHKLRYVDYVNIIKPLLGFDLTMADFNDNLKINRILHSENSKNIITPIFDALYQAKMMLGYTPSIDLVLLNGGMSRIHIIKERIKKLFNHNNVFEIIDPDLSVAKGAVIHNYNITHNLGKSSNIIAESILLEGAGGFIELIPSGTKYPTLNPILHSRLFSIPRDHIDYINLPLYRGKNGTKIPIIDRIVHFRENSTKVRKGDAIDIQVAIDQNRTLKFEAWLHDNPNIRFDVTLGI